MQARLGSLVTPIFKSALGDRNEAKTEQGTAIWGSFSSSERCAHAC